MIYARVPNGSASDRFLICLRSHSVILGDLPERFPSRVDWVSFHRLTSFRKSDGFEIFRATLSPPRGPLKSLSSHLASAPFASRFRMALVVLWFRTSRASFGGVIGKVRTHLCRATVRLSKSYQPAPKLRLKLLTPSEHPYLAFRAAPLWQPTPAHIG